MEVLYVFSEGFDILVNCIWSHASNLDQAVVLDEYCVAGQVAVDDWRVTAEEISFNTEGFHTTFSARFINFTFFTVQYVRKHIDHIKD